MFFSKPSGGPDSVGGLFPTDFPSVKCRNRSGGTHIKGEVVMLPMRPGVATEIATNDSNSYKPGFSNDTIWNTVVDPTSNTTTGGKHLGSLVAVCVSDSVADNAIGEYQFFGIVEAAFVVRSGGSALPPGNPLTVTVTNSFNGTIASNQVIVAHFIDRSTTATARALRRVFLHNGFFPTPGVGTQA